MNKVYFKTLSKTNIKIKVLVHIVGCWLLLFCFSCQSQPIDKVLSELPMNIDNVTNFRLEDDPAATPSYDYYDKKLAAFITINFTGKTEQEKMYWDVDNPSGYFSYYKGVTEPYFLSNEIKKHLLERGLDNYDITAMVIYKKDIEIYSDDDLEFLPDDLDFKPDAYTYLYHFKHNHWVFDKAEKIKKD